MRYTTKQAALLSIAALSLHSAANGQSIDTAATQAGSPVALEEVIVYGHRRDYLLKGSRSGVGLDLDLMETPASVSVIAQDILQDQQVNNVDDALRNVAGVAKFKTGNGGEEKFSIRGFDASSSIYKDGARINNGLNASNIPSTETANIERIDVLKGPSALLYGQGEPGGIINYITKRPDFERATLVEVLAGSDEFYKLEFDHTNAFGDSEQWAYRVVAAYEDSGSFRDEVERERLLIQPSITYQWRHDSRIIASFEYIDDAYTQDRGQVLDGDNDVGYRYSGRQDIGQFYGIPNWNTETEAESERWHIFAEHSLTDFWRVEATYAQTDNDKTNVDSSPLVANFRTGAVIGAAGGPAENLVSIQPRRTAGEGETSQATLRNFLDFDSPGGWEHKLLASADWEDFKTTTTSFRGDRNVFFNVVSGEYFSQFDADDLANPDIITPTDDIAFLLNDRGSSVSGNFQQWGINVVDHISFNDRWSILLGARYTDFKDQSGDFSEDDLSFRAGLVFAPVQALSLYLSYSEGFTPSGGALGLDDKPLDAETSESWEIGIKWAGLNDSLLVTGTLYSIEQANLPFVANPLDEDGNPTPPADLRSASSGEVRSNGLEIEVVGKLTDDWRIQAGYAYIDNEIRSGGETVAGAFFPVGNTLPGVAEHSLNLFTFYELPLFRGILGLGGGIFYQDDVFISTENRGTYDAWTQVDFATYYKLDRWKLQLNLRNAFDEEYLQAQALTTAESFAALRVGTSIPRTLIGSVAYAL
ncbi:MAG: TonB-dependent siderophore receptor [Pseudomonadota bacterium]